MAPTLLLVPGSFCPASHYDSLLAKLKSKGYSGQAIDLPTVTKRPGPLPTMHDDAAHINAVAAKLADEGKDVVLVAHSYGGVPASESLKRVTKTEREKAGKKGGVVRVAYLTALVPELGTSCGSHMGGEGSDAPAGYVIPDEDGWLYHHDHALTASYVFTGLTAEQGLAACKEFTQHSSVSFGDELNHAGYKDVLASYLYCENDKCVTPKIQQKSIDTIEKASGKKVDVTRIPTDHCPEVSAPEKVIDWFVHLIEKGGQE